MDIEKIGWMSLLLTKGERRWQEAQQIGDRTAILLDEATTVLAPIVGKIGVARILAANRVATSEQYPWLVDASVDHSLSEPAILRMLLNAQEPGLAQAAGEAILLNFYTILTELVGESLIEIVLKPVWATSNTSQSAGT